MFRGDVEGLRALAVFAVLLFHFDFAVFQGGFIGVDIFFVISGYVISKGMHSRISAGTFQYSDFYTRRFRRILPALIATTCFVLLAGFMFLSVDAYRDLGLSSIYSTLSLSNFYFAKDTGYFAADAVEKPLLHMWSLSVEEQFYLIWPLIFVTISRRVRKEKLFRAISVLAVLFVLVSEIWVLLNANYAFYMAPARFFEFLLGASVVAAEGKYSPKSPSAYNGIFIVGLIICLTAIFTYDEKMRFPGITALVPSLAVALMIFSGSRSGHSIIFSNSVARYFGKISYSLYLVHWPLVVFYKYLFGRELALPAKFGLLVMSVGLAHLMWRFVEQPFRTKAERDGQVSNKQFYAGLVCAVSITIVISSLIYTNQGLVWRLDQQPANLYQALKQDLQQRLPCTRAEGTGRHFGCFNFFGEKSTRPADAILIGDSHVHNFLYGLSDFFSENGLRGAYSITPGCPPIRGAQFIREGHPFWDMLCRGNSDSSFEYANTEHVGVVILAGRWALYTNQDRLGVATDANPHIFLAEDADDERSSTRSKVVFKTRMEKTIDELVSQGKKVVVFGQVPEINFDIKRCLFHPGFIHQEYADCSPDSFSDAMENIAFTNRTLKNIADKYPESVLFLDTSQALCDKECMYMKGDNSLYMDNNHLSYTGSLLVVKYFSRKISAFISTAVRGQPK